ncbi:MAG: outer membrane beta-barrel protein [Colwellia sp.]
MKAWKLAPLAVALVSAQSFAVDPIGVALGSGFTLLPSVETSVESNDNIYSATKGAEVSSSITRLKPSFSLQGDLGALKLNTAYQLEQGLYSKKSKDDYLDQNLTVGGDYELNARNQLNVDATYNAGHDAAGSVKGIETSTNPNAEPDEFSETTAGLVYTFGGESANVNVNLIAESYQKRYDNHEDQEQVQLREHDKTKVAAQLVFNVSPATSVDVEFRNTDITYVSSKADALAREGNEKKFLLGSSWDITGATTGEFKLGMSERTFDLAGISSNSSLVWEGSVTWQPLSYSTVVVSTSKGSSESAGADSSYLDGSSTSVSWDHEFSYLLSAGVKASYGEDDYVDSTRIDINTGYGVQATYAPMSWMDVTASWDFTKRNSDEQNLDTDTNIFNLAVTLAL